MSSPSVTGAAFRASTVGIGINIQDLTLANTPGVQPGAGWTLGATLIDQIATAGNRSSNPWQVNSLSVRASLNIDRLFVEPYFGKLGKIKTGLTLQSATPQQGTAGAYVTQLLPLPADISMCADLFDPASDPLPPDEASGTSLPLAVGLNLPTPLVVPSGGAVGVGIWMLPSLLSVGSAQNTALFMYVTNAVWQINYSVLDQGQGPIS